MSKVLLCSILKGTGAHFREPWWSHWAATLLTPHPPNWTSGLVKVSERNEKPVSISVAVDVSLQTGSDASSEGLEYLLGLISAWLASGRTERVLNESRVLISSQPDKAYRCWSVLACVEAWEGRRWRGFSLQSRPRERHRLKHSRNQRGLRWRAKHTGASLSHCTRLCAHMQSIFTSVTSILQRSVWFSQRSAVVTDKRGSPTERSQTRHTSTKQLSYSVMALVSSSCL